MAAQGGNCNTWGKNCYSSDIVLRPFQLKQWNSSGEKLTTPMLDTIVAACSRRVNVNGAFETFEMYEQLGLKHRTESYNSLMEVCARQKQIEVIMKLLQEMANENVKPNVDTYMQVTIVHQRLLGRCEFFGLGYL